LITAVLRVGRVILCRVIVLQPTTSAGEKGDLDGEIKKERSVIVIKSDKRDKG
jgi:hypothetical protein